MNENFDLQTYLTKGIERVLSEAIRATLQNPRESAFLVKFTAAARAAAKRRRIAEDNGEHIPSFLIASITSQCNLHCAGCYSRCNHATVDAAPVRQLTSDEWLRIFGEADELGISFILLAGGEPLLRRDIVEAAGKKQNMMFPIFTNGTYMSESYFEMFDKCRNLLPVMSIEGSREVTDARRGAGIYDKLIANMDELQRRGLVFGASVTVTTQNYRDVCSEAFLSELSGRGCKAVIYVEYVPVTEESKELAPTDNEREYLRAEILRLRKSGGCVAAGRGFFHINSHGGAEPCPFSPYSDVNVKNTSLREAMHSPLFTALQSGDILLDDHEGGCVLYEKRELVEALINQQRGA